MWTGRPKQVSRVIDRVLEDKALGPHIQRERIGVVGHSSGGYTALAVALVAAAAIATATALRRELQAHVAMAFLVAGTLVVAGLVLTAPLTGRYLDSATHVPVAAAFPGYLRVSSVPFNAGGGLALVFGALYSAYIYMPKKRVVPARMGALAIIPNFFASLPGAVTALIQGKLNSRVPATILIAVGEDYNIFLMTRVFLGEFMGLVLIFVGFLVSEDVFRNVRLGTTLWSRAPSASLESEVG